MLPVRTILVPIDFSDQSRFAFRLACAIARESRARVIAMHVLIPPTIVYGEGVVPPVPPDYPAEWVRKLEEIQAPPSVRMEHLLVEGDPTTEILNAARAQDCDLIVMGTHGRSGIGRFILGSVTEKVLRQAPCPVLTARAPIPVPEGRTPAPEAMRVEGP